MIGAIRELRVPVRLQTRARRSEIVGMRAGRLQVRTTAPPADGRANRDVTRQLADEFGVAPSQITLKNGATGRDKLFIIERPRRMPEYMNEL